jgi:hypothetical protein
VVVATGGRRGPRAGEGEEGKAREQALGGAVRDVREPTYRALVKTLTGRSVSAYLSEVDATGVAFEAFVLDR